MKKGKVTKQRGTQLKRGARLASKKSNVKGGSISCMSLINKPRASLLLVTVVVVVMVVVMVAQEGDETSLPTSLKLSNSRSCWGVPRGDSHSASGRLAK